MLIKKSQYKSVMFTVSICLVSILLAILVAYACDSLKEAMDDAARAYHDAQQTLIDYESSWASEILLWGGGKGAAAGTVGTFLVKGTLQTASKAIPGGAAIAIADKAIEYTRRVAELQADVDEKSAAYEAARGAYEACANPPERYTYTDYGGHVYEFTSKEAYNDFLRNRGLSTI